MSNVQLLALPEVQRELKLGDERLKVIERLVVEQQQAIGKTLETADFGELRTLEREAHERRLAEIREKVAESQQKTDAQANLLLDDLQRTRLQQLRLQRDGVSAWERNDVAERLELSAEQRDALAKIRQSARPRPPGFGMPDLSRIEEQRRLAERSSLAVLNDMQREKWAAMQGAEFSFPPSSFLPPGMGGPGGPGGAPRELVKQFDKDGDGRLNREERAAARPTAKSGVRGGPGAGGPGGRGFGPPGGMFGAIFGGPPRGGPPGNGPDGPRGGREAHEPGKPGPRVSPADIRSFGPDPNAGSDAKAPDLYDPAVLRTLFLEFENDDWESELTDFHNTDVEVSATMTVDGRRYSGVGVHFRGMSSYMMIPPGSKRSLNLSVDFADPKQRLYGYKTLNLLNSHEDATFLHTTLYSHIARQYIPAPKANFVRLVVNGESWGVYVNAQQFNKEFLAENYPSAKGVRWKVSGSPAGGGGLAYLGDRIDDYKRRYEMKTDDGDKAWLDLISLCKTLQETPVDRLEAALAPKLDIDGALWFLALDVALVNSDGYWIRASDYSLFRDAGGKFHLIPHDMNEAFQPPMGPGLGGGPRGGRPDAPGRPPAGGGQTGFDLDPLVALDDPSKPLRSRLLAAPNLRARYLHHVRTIAEKSLDWSSLAPVVQQARTLIEPELEIDTRKLTSLAAFQAALADQPADLAETERRPTTNLKTFVEQRRRFLLEHPEVKAAPNP